MQHQLLTGIACVTCFLCIFQASGSVALLVPEVNSTKEVQVAKNSKNQTNISTTSVSACSSQTTCSECVATSGWSGGCRWCEIDNSCHNYGSLMTPCHSFENIYEDQYCRCSSPTCKPTPGHDSSVCTWYTMASGSKDPSAWFGGDFLPLQYASAAQCACSGGTNKIWAKNPPAASCVRTYLLNHHKAMNSSFRQYIKDTPYVQNYKYVDFFYNMHVEAYKSCCCSGKPAPYVTWMAVFYASAIIPCNYIPVLPSQTTEIGQILTYGRCGCGW